MYKILFIIPLLFFALSKSVSDAEQKVLPTASELRVILCNEGVSNEFLKATKLHEQLGGKKNKEEITKIISTEVEGFKGWPIDSFNENFSEIDLVNIIFSKVWGTDNGK